MKPILNEWSLPWERGAILKLWYDEGRNHTRYYLIDSELCQRTGSPCKGCLTGNLKIIVRKFRKRPGNITFSLCPGLGPRGAFVLDEPVNIGGNGGAI